MHIELLQSPKVFHGIFVSTNVDDFQFAQKFQEIDFSDVK